MHILNIVLHIFGMMSNFFWDDVQLFLWWCPTFFGIMSNFFWEMSNFFSAFTVVMKGKGYKAKIREKDNQKIEVLLWNWSDESRIKDYKEEEEAIWLIYSKKHEASKLIYKAHWGSGSHLHIKRIVEEIKKLGYWWDKWKRM